MSELGRIIGQQVADWVAVNEKAIQRRAFLVGRLVVWAGRYKSNQVYVFNDMVMFRSYIALAMEDSPRGLPQPGGAGWRIVANLATGGVDNFPDVAGESALALNTPLEVVTSAISRWAMKQIEDAVTSVPGLVRWRGWWSSDEVYGDRDLVLYNRSVWLNAGGDGVPSRNGWEWLLSTQSGNVPEVGIPAPVLAFHALVPDDDGAMVGVKTGIGPLTADHASSIYAKDHEDIYREFGANEPVWKGGRVVKNLALHSNDFTNAVWQEQLTATKEGTVSIAGPDGDTITAMEVAFGNNAASSIYQDCQSTSSIPKIGTFYVRAVSGSTTVRVFSGSMGTDTTVDETWKRITQASTGVSNLFYLKNNSTGTSANVYVCQAQSEEGTGRIDTTTPSEYIPTGASVVQKVFAHANGNSVVNNVVTEARGADFAEVPWLQYTPLATNDQKYSNDLTNTLWIKNNSSCTFDQIGLTGLPNSASVLGDDSGGGSGSVYVNDTHGVVSGETNCFVVYAKKKQLSWIRLWAVSFDTDPYVFFDLDNKVVGTSIADDAEIVDLGNDWCKCILEWTTTTDVIGVLRTYLANSDLDSSVDRDGTSDVYIGNIELHKGKTVAEVRGLPPIFTEGAPVSIDQTQYSFDASNHDDDNGASIIEVETTFNNNEISGQHRIFSTQLLYLNNGMFRSYDGTTGVNWLPSYAIGDKVKIGIGWDSGQSLYSGFVDGVEIDEVAYDGDWANPMILLSNMGQMLKLRDIRWYSGDYDALKDTIKDETS